MAINVYSTGSGAFTAMRLKTRLLRIRKHSSTRPSPNLSANQPPKSEPKMAPKLRTNRKPILELTP
ncbi:hypothetical protein D3C85_1707380 [compost metagenome]